MDANQGGSKLPAADFAIRCLVKRIVEDNRDFLRRLESDFAHDQKDARVRNDTKTPDDLGCLEMLEKLASRASLPSGRSSASELVLEAQKALLRSLETKDLRTVATAIVIAIRQSDVASLRSIEGFVLEAELYYKEHSPRSRYGRDNGVIRTLRQVLHYSVRVLEEPREEPIAC